MVDTDDLVSGDEVEIIRDGGRCTHAALRQPSPGEIGTVVSLDVPKHPELIVCVFPGGKFYLLRDRIQRVASRRGSGSACPGTEEGYPEQAG